MAAKLIRGGHVITDPERLPSGGLIEHGAVAVEGDSVVAVGTYDELKGRFPGAEEIGSERHVVIPGLINTHHHGWGLTPFQFGLLDDSLEPWIMDIWALPAVDAYLDCLWSDMRNIRSGVTTLLHASYGRNFGGYEVEARAKLRAHADSGIRVAFALHVLDQNLFVYEDNDRFLARLPDEVAGRMRDVLAELAPAGTEDFFSLLGALHGEYAGHDRIKIMACPIAPQWVSDPLLRRVRDVTTEYGMGIHLHCLESPYQREVGLASYGKSTVEHLEGLGLLGSDVSLGHGVWMTERDMDICAQTGASVCHNASSNLRLRVGIMAAARMLEKGVNVSIGMDGTTLNDDEDMLQEMRLVHKLGALPRGLEYAACPTSFDVLRMATVNGARSTTFGPSIGSLAPGKKADIVLIDGEPMRAPYLGAAVHVVDAVLHRARGMDVDTVLVGGEVVLRDKEFTKLDHASILAELCRSADLPPEPVTQRWMQATRDIRPHVAAFYKRWETPAYEPCYTVNSLS